MGWTLTVPKLAYRKAVLANNPVGYWRLGETSGTTAFDSSGNGHDGSYIDAPTLGTTGLILNDDNTAVTFNGSSERADVTDRAALDITGALTLEAWFQRTNNPVDFTEGIIAKYQGQTGTPETTLVSVDERAYTLGMTPDGYLEAVVSPDGTFASAVSVVESVDRADGNTYHVVFTYIPSTSITLYVNGSQVAQNTTSIPASLHNSSADLWIGTQFNKDRDVLYWDGILDEVAIYNKALTPAQIQQHYRAGR